MDENREKIDGDNPHAGFVSRWLAEHGAAELATLVAQHGERALWEKLRSDGFALDLAGSAELVQGFLIFGQLDRAYSLSRAMFPVVADAPPPLPREQLAWAHGVCAMVRAAHLANTSDLALHWWMRASDAARMARCPRDVIDVLTEESCHLFFDCADCRDEQRPAMQGVCELLDREWKRFCALKERGIYEASLLADIAMHYCDLFVMSELSGIRLPDAVIGAAVVPYLIYKDPPWWESIDPEVSGVNRFGLRHAASAAAYAACAMTVPNDFGEKIQIDANDRELALPAYVGLDLALLDFVSASDNFGRVLFGGRFLDAVCDWRREVKHYKYRSTLRTRLSAISGRILSATRPVARCSAAESPGTWALLSDAEDILGPSKWLEERLSDAIKRGPLAATDTPAIFKHVRESIPYLFRERGRVLHVLPAGDDLFMVAHDIGSRAALSNPAVCGCRVENGMRDLRAAWEKSFGRSGKIAAKIECIRRTPRTFENFGNYKDARKELHALIRDAANDVANVFSRARFSLVPNEPADVLLVCTDPMLLGLPWSLVPVGGRPLFEKVRSLTVSSSIGASAALAELAASRDYSEPFDITAFCDCGEHGELKWDRMFVDESGEPCGLKTLGVPVRTFGITRCDGHRVGPELLDRYPVAESAVLLVAGHGDPKKGVRLGDSHWDPRRIPDNWRLQRTECAVLPSCQLGKLLWEGQTNDDGPTRPIDPSKSELTGFVAHLCLAGIPRVLACPWVAYDLPIGHLIEAVFNEALDLRRTGEPHYWARALRNVVVRETEGPAIEQNSYDLANLLLFGAP